MRLVGGGGGFWNSFSIINLNQATAFQVGNNMEFYKIYEIIISDKKNDFCRSFLFIEVKREELPILVKSVIKN